MNKYAIPLLVGLLAIGIATINAEEKSANPFSDSAIKVEESTNKGTESTAKVEAKEEKKAKEGNFPVNGTVAASYLRIRQWPWGPVMGMHNYGTSVTVTGVSGEFYAVTIDGLSGYMHKNYISIPGAPASCVAPYYPGNTASGGYLPKAEGEKYSNSAASGNSGSNVSYKGKAESGDLAKYPGGKLPPAKFIALFGPVARESMKQTGVPASVTLAQAILETGWGGSSIGDAKNLFGIKGTGPAGTTVVHTQECYDGSTYVTIKDGFRKYHTWQQSIDDHAALLQTSRYAGALNAYKQNHNADQYAVGIHKAGYATSPTYAQSLQQLMKQYNLYEWDI